MTKAANFWIATSPLRSANKPSNESHDSLTYSQGQITSKTNICQRVPQRDDALGPTEEGAEMTGSHLGGVTQERSPGAGEGQGEGHAHCLPCCVPWAWWVAGIETCHLATCTPRHHSGQSTAVSHVGQGPATSSCLAGPARWPQDHHPEGVTFSFEVTHYSRGQSTL